jgi:hypothetical protein
MNLIYLLTETTETSDGATFSVLQAYTDENKAKVELGERYYDTLEACDRCELKDFERYTVTISEFKNINSWRIVSESHPEYYRHMWIEKVPVIE